VSEAVDAAGGVVVRNGRIALVHRPRYDDWTLPKGKLEPGERHDDAALREVEEETGMRCTLGRELPSARYRDRHDRPKLVRYFRMEAVAGEFSPNDEVDELRWVTPREALGLLTYDRDRDVVRALGAD
jgi:8-oxo-dGTP diphosphatase